MAGRTLTVPDPGRRAELAEFVGRVVQLDPAATVRLHGSAGQVTAWAITPFDVLATRAVPGELVPADLAVPAMSLLTALAVERAGTVDPGPAGVWRAELPPETGWQRVGEQPVAAWSELLDRRLRAGPERPPEGVLDETVATVPARSGPAVRIPLRCLYALSGLGLLTESDPGSVVAVAATRSWLRLDTPEGGVVRRRISTLPLLVSDAHSPS